MRDNLIKRSWFTICRRLFNGCNVAEIRGSLLVADELVSPDNRTSAACRVTGCGVKMRLYLKISELIHFQSKNNVKMRYVFTVVITSNILITTEIHNWLNHVFMSLLSPLAEPADNESVTDGHLTGMGTRLITNICLNFPDPVFSQCKVANFEL